MVDPHVLLIMKSIDPLFIVRTQLLFLFFFLVTCYDNRNNVVMAEEIKVNIEVEEVDRMSCYVERFLKTDEQVDGEKN